MPLLAVVFIALFGLCIGSFINVVALRVPEHRSVIGGRSGCPACSSLIAWYDNIPVLSWLLLGARCRHCRLPISGRYPLMEGATGVCFAAAATVISRPIGLAVALCAATVVITALALATSPTRRSLSTLSVERPDGEL